MELEVTVRVSSTEEFEVRRLDCDPDQVQSLIEEGHGRVVRTYSEQSTFPRVVEVSSTEPATVAD